MIRILTVFLAAVCFTTCQHPADAAEHKVLIIDGQNNHVDWPKITAMMKESLESTGLFEVEVERTQYTWKGSKHLPKYNLPGVSTKDLPQPKTDPNFKPTFADYDVVISNFGYNAAAWPKETQEAFASYIRNGGGLVVVHAADNSFGDWPEYNEMIGLGGWGGRNEKSGPYVYVNEAGDVVRDESAGRGGAHGPQHEYSIVIRDTKHPITAGLPREWKHTQDELYQELRGPATQMNILATAYASPEFRGTGRHEPMLMTITYGEGRIFHTPMGHADYSAACVGFQTVLNRGTEWAATGKVTQEVPKNFPTATETSSRQLAE